MKNPEIAQIFEQMADIMEIQGENPFRVNSYRKVARVLTDLPEDVEQVMLEGRLTEISGIGKGTAEKIEQYLKTGRMDVYERLVEDFPMGALEMLRIPSLGPKTVARFIKEFSIDSVDRLEEALQKGELDQMAGLRQKSIESIRRGIELLKKSRGRTNLGLARPIAEEIVGMVREKVSLGLAEPAGSLRRGKETVGDVDILVTLKKSGGRKAAPGGRDVVEAFTTLDLAAEVLASGDTKGSIRTREGLQVDLRVVEPDSFGAALQYFTGSKAHNVHLRGLAADRGLKINEYGVFEGDKKLAGKTEDEVYGCLDLPWIPPELREDNGEIEAAAEGRLPRLLTLQDIAGDLHVHTHYSDGTAAPLQVAQAAKQAGYSFVVLADHSKSLTIGGGLSEERLRERNREIDRARKEIKGFTILKGTEVDILGDGSLDYDDEILAGLDVVVAAIHSRFGMGEEEMTARMCRAAQSPHVDIIAHPTGRLLGARDAYKVNVGVLIETCARCHTALELNAHAERLDISDVVCRQAKRAGVKVAIGTDAHNPASLGMMGLGVITARRGWLEPTDVLNCLPPQKLLDYLKGT